MQNNKQRDAFKATLIHKTADITHVSTRQVRRVINGTSKNEAVMTVYMELLEGSNKLVDAVKMLVPFRGLQDVELEMGWRRDSEQ